ncbi:MAG: response regulator [Leptolyngbya sp. BL-A-14]
MIRLLLIDDQDLIRRGMKALLKSDDTLQVVGEAANGQDAIALVGSLTPDVVLMDVRMPIMDGVAATKEICQQFPGVKILVLTTFDDQEYVTQALQNGASGYLLKDTPFDELVQAIRFIHKGYTHIGPGLVHKAVTAAPPAVAATPALTELTPREQEILQLIAQGASNREIAQTLYISEKTVRNHVTNILSRLGLRDRTQAAIVALQQNLLTGEV